MSTPNKRTDEERMLAAVSHAAILTGAIAPVVGLVVYINQKEKSTYAAGQALQAVAYQLASILLMILSWGCWGIVYMLSFVPLMADPYRYQAGPPTSFWLGMGSMICPFIVMGLLGMYGLFGALRTWQGADFHYAVVGKMVEKRLPASD
jgi:uncharacterized Tic20 family protein